MLALLLVDAPRGVSTGSLIDGLWDEAPPETARKTLQGYVHHLRTALGGALETDAVGYRLDMDSAAIDAVEFQARVSAARSLVESAPLEASEELAAALAMWRGRPYADLDGSLALEPEIARLEELRLGALEDRLSADLAVGADPSLIGELESLAREYPLRERMRALHMEALYRSGRQAEALRAFDETRRYLGEELGLEPSRELRELEQRIFSQQLEIPDRLAPAVRSERGVRGYELRGAIGSGPIGTVHTAYHSNVGRSVALKAFRPELADDAAFIETFGDESRRIGSIAHDHIVPLLDTWREPGAAYQVTPWMEGGNLQSRLDHEGIPLPAALRILDDVGSALSYAHRIGFGHGRLKPTNVLFDLDGQSYVSDFGLSGAFPAPSEAELPFVAPEVGDGGGPGGAAADVFSLGAIARQLLGGAPGGETDKRLLAAIDRACHPDPAQRFERVEDLARALKQAAGVDVTASATVAINGEKSTLRNPYKGLRAFQADDAADFFGREELVDRLAATLDERRFVAVVGPSGIGKSSVVKAGLIPTLRRRQEGDDTSLLVAEMFPGTHPFEELARALTSVAVGRPNDLVADLMSDDRGLLRTIKQVLPAETELLLVIDQFEELFTLVADESRRRLFLANLQEAVADERAHISIVITMRADFYDRPLEYPEFGPLVEAGVVTVLVPSQEGLSRAIAAPARSVGLELQDGLVSEIVRDVLGQPGGLPLMQYALTELFDRRDSDTLTLDGYRATGGVLGALGTRAEELWQGLAPSGREAIRQTFLRLVTVDENADDTRRRVRRSELASLDVSQRELNAAITLFGAHRLLTFDRDQVTRGPTIEVAHEALLREWARLRGLIEAQREDLVLHRLLATELGEWEGAHREQSYLLRGGRLAQFELWEGSTDITLTVSEKEFLDASRTLREAEEESERQTQRRLRSMLVGVSVLAVVALVAGVVAFVQARGAQSSADIADTAREAAETRRLALQAPQLADTNRQVALLLAVEAFRRDPSDPATLGALQSVFVSSGNSLGYVVPDSPARGAGFTADGDLVVLAGSDIIVYDSDSRSRSRVIDASGAEMFAVSPAASSAAFARSSLVTVVDLVNQGQLDQFDALRASPVTSLEFNRDGTLLGVGFDDGALLVRDLATGTNLTIDDAHPERSFEGIEIPPHLPDQAQFGTRAIAFSDNGTLVATGGLIHARVWDLSVTPPQRILDIEHERRAPDDTRIPEGVRSVRFAPGSGDLLYVASSINVAVHDVATGQVVNEEEFPGRVDVVVNAAGEDELILTDTAAVLAEGGGRVIELPVDGSGPVGFDTHLPGRPHLAVDGDSSDLAIASPSGVALWSLRGERLIATSVPRGRAFEAILSADGDLMTLNTSVGVPIDVYRRTGSRWQEVDFPIAQQSGHVGAADGMVAWSLEDGLTRYWSFAENPPTPQVIEQGKSIFAFAYSSEGKWFAGGAASDTSDVGAVVEVYDLERGEPVSPELTDLVVPLEGPAETAPRSSVLSLSFNPDATRLAGVNSVGRAVIWNTGTWQVEMVIAQGGGQVLLAEYSPDGRFLVTTASDGTMLLRDPDTLAQLGDALIGQTSGVEGLSAGPSFTADGRYMMSTADGIGRVWDLETRSQVGTGFPSLPNSGSNTSRDGRLMTTFGDEEVIIWSLDFENWTEVACRAAGRNLTLEEWEQFAPAGETYRRTCEIWPSAVPDGPSEEET